MKTLKFGSDFSGIGSPELALKNLNIPIKKIFACEIDKYARKSFTSIHGDEGVFYNDITKRNHSEVEKLDLYVAGFPCQAFSLAGSRKGFEDVRGTLFFNVAEFIKTNQPETFVLENVKGLISHDSGKTFQTILSLLSDGGGTVNKQMFIPYFTDGLGYHIYYKVLNTKDFEIPQNRERVFIVGFKKFRNFSFPVQMPLKLKLKHFLQDNPEYFKLIDGFNSFKNIKYVDNDVCGTITQHQNRKSMTNGFKIEYYNINDKYFLTDTGLKNLIKNQTFNKFKLLDYNSDYCNVITARCNKINNDNPFLLMPIHKKYFLSDQAIKTITKDGDSIANCLRKDISKNGRGDNYLIIKTNNKKSVEKAKEGDSVDFEQPNSTTRRGRVQKQISHTIQTAMNHGVLLSGRIRRLTPLECFRLQGFDDESFFRAQKVNSDTQLYKQAGNSITVNVLMKIFEKIYNDEYNSEKS